jgi:uncharacterized protein (DUF342 family)
MTASTPASAAPAPPAPPAPGPDGTAAAAGSADAGAAVRIALRECSTAVLQIDSVVHKDGVELDVVRRRLQEMGIKLNQDVERRLADLTDQNGRIRAVESVVIAQATEPQDDVPGRLELLVQAESQPTEFTSHYDRGGILLVQPEQPVARWHPPVAGRDGIDIFGKVIPRRVVKGAELQLGPNVKLDAQTQTVVATARGRMSAQGTRVWVDQILEINGNVDFSIGHINFPADVVVRGTVLDLFKVDSGGTVQVTGAVEAAEVEAKGSIFITGGIVGKGKGICRAAADLTAKFITNATASAGGNLTAQVEIANSIIFCSGKVTVAEGPILASRVTANGGVSCQSLGSPAGGQTIIDAGLDLQLCESAVKQHAEAQAQLQRAQKIRATVEPLLQRAKNLTAAQKEQATELVYNASEAEESARQTIARLTQQLLERRTRAQAEVHVSGTIYAGTQIRFLGVQTSIDKPLEGPVTIHPRMSEQGLKIIAHRLGGASTVLDSRPYLEHAHAIIKSLLPQER